MNGRCFYCKNPGHTIDQCLKKQWADQQWNKGPVTTSFSNQQWTANVSLHHPLVRQTAIPLSHVWIVDSAANTHIQPYRERFSRFTLFTSPQTVTGVGNTIVSAYGTGSVILTDNDQRHFTVENVLYVPDAKMPILSMFKLQRQGLYTRQLQHAFKLSTSTNNFCLLGQTHDDILRVAESYQNRPSYSLTALLTTRLQAARESQVNDDIDSDSTAPTTPQPPETTNEAHEDTTLVPRLSPAQELLHLQQNMSSPVPRINAYPDDQEELTRPSKRRRILPKL